MSQAFKIYNTLSRKIEEFTPLNPPKIGMYTCGPTVYDYTHIGHLRKYIGDDILRRLLEVNGLEVKHVMNITDVGHLTSDADEGDDKMEKGAKEKNMTVFEVAKFYTDYFVKALDSVNILRPNVVAPATEHIGEQIKLIEKLEKNDFIYQTNEAIYFNIAKFPEYGKLSGQSLEEKMAGAREGVVVDEQKKNPQDFALWFFTIGKFADHSMKWSSPWGEGFPGWHIECSAMSMEYLGETIDIHTGGIDHIPVHHENEIAQSEAATGKQFVRFWVHHNFLQIDGGKMSKSLKNFYTIDDIKEKGFDPMALRYLFLTAHYRDKLNFTWESLGAAQNTLNNIREEIRLWESPKEATGEYWQRFLSAANNDLGIPQAVAVLHDLIKNKDTIYSASDDLLAMDKILGLGLDEYLGKPLDIPAEVLELVEKRENVRKAGDFQKSDEIRKQILDLGFKIEDSDAGPILKPAH